MNGKLTFSIHDTHLSSPLPVEIRKPNFLLVDKGLTSETKELEPGKYYVTARMPAGQKISAEVVVKTDATVNVVLIPEPAEASPHEFQAEQHFNIGEKRMSRRQITNHLNPTFDDMFFKRLDDGEDFIASHLESMSVPTAEPNVSNAALLIFKGNLFSSEPLEKFPLEDRQVEGAENFVRIAIDSSYETLYAQLRQANVPPLNFALPISDRFGCTLVVQREANHNLGKQRWQGIENFVLDGAKAAKRRACVFTGPVFDDDPELNGVQVPLAFRKIVVFVRTGARSAPRAPNPTGRPEKIVTAIGWKCSKAAAVTIINRRSAPFNASTRQTFAKKLPHG